MNDENVNQVFEKKLYKPMGLISILEKIQSKYIYLIFVDHVRPSGGK